MSVHTFKLCPECKVASDHFVDTEFGEVCIGCDTKAVLEALAAHGVDLSDLDELPVEVRL